ncbi:hypothetical protein HNQ80_001741 [Anaerosolibacter carboniphilus]|uniref:Uncharacterized protein n=1 Tax=Anaerosolibacter carboniphilus TaxID=1417629 RepID=A0A841KXJ3_9FIRM|nr:hypothetical protein [Anaerosolibacter carboniphilus]MBB6215652.1 hypothetical protein [Anaerosolibacter carboniphilus]
MINHCTLNLNAIETMNFFWSSIASKEKLSEKFILDIAILEPFQNTYNDEFTQESVRRCLSALSNKEPFSGNKVENRFYSRNLMILEYIDSLDEKITAFKGIRINDILHFIGDLNSTNDINSLEIIVVPSPFDTVQCQDNKIILNFFKFHLIDGELKADDLTIPEIIKEALSNR